MTPGHIIVQRIGRSIIVTALYLPCVMMLWWESGCPLSLSVIGSIFSDEARRARDFVTEDF